MKKLIILLLPVLTSCAAVDAYLMTKFDPNEYQLITEIRTDASHYKNECNTVNSSANSIALSRKTEVFKAYSEHLPRNTDSFNAATSLNDIAQGLSDKYIKGDKVSPFFCKLKFEGIEHSADLIQTTLGNRPR